MTSGPSTPVDRKTLEALKTRMRGPVFFPGDAGYEDGRSVWNAAIDRKPAVIVRCLGTADVVAGVNFARDAGIALSIKGGGHNIAGLAVGEDSLLLDTSHMRGVWIDHAAGTAHTQPGCLLGDVDRETQLRGLAAVLGFVSMTGVAGLTLGGGFGYLSRRFGWTCDNVRSMEVVTADGKLVRASEHENPDLLWALRGGGGNFGVVTDFEHKLYPVGPEIVGGGIAWRAEEAPKILALYKSLADASPPEFACVATLRIAPPAPWLSKEIHGKPIIALFVCDTGPIAAAEQRAAVLKSFGTPVGDMLQRRTYVSQQTLLDGTQPKGRRYYWKSEYLSALSPELFNKAIEHAGRMVSPHSAIVFFPLGGALNQLAEDHSPAGNRTAASLFNIQSSWEKKEDDQKNMEWARAAWADMRPFSTGGTYVNFLNEEEGDERIHAAYGKHYERLVAAKTKWDPTNLFRMNKNIAPRSTKTP